MPRHAVDSVSTADCEHSRFLSVRCRRSEGAAGPPWSRLLHPVPGHVPPLPFTAADIFALLALKSPFVVVAGTPRPHPHHVPNPAQTICPYKYARIGHRQSRSNARIVLRALAFHFCSVARRQAKFSRIVGPGSGAQETRALVCELEVEGR